MERDNGGSAFPNPHVQPRNDGEPGWKGCSGMTLRDYFAAKALTLFLRVPASSLPDAAENIAQCAYAMADAMLAERGKP